MTFIQSYPIVIPFLCILAAEFTKSLIDLINKRHKLRFVNPGGMPSGHSAFVASLVVVVANRHGLASTEFMISAVIALIVMYDAINLRGEAGKHAAAINKHHPDSHLEESLGHNHWEVVVGATFGALLSAFLLIL